MKISKDTKIRAMKVALERAKVWFESFGYNAYGIDVKDGLKDHTEILEEIECALEIEAKEEK